MSATATVQVNVSSWDGHKEYARTFLTSSGASPVADQSGFAFATGFNTLTVPTGAGLLLVSNISGTLTLKGISGDTGRVLATTTFPIILSVVSAGTISFNASAGATADLLWI